MIGPFEEVFLPLPRTCRYGLVPTMANAMSDAPLSISRRTQHRWSWIGAQIWSLYGQVLGTRKLPYWVRPVPLCHRPLPHPFTLTASCRKTLC
ncbi:hypothetical protein B0H34DRAFT_530326 [Crassisporium funariophilum]|nr:hypothetical protein B0H34DRAFT_530326 [Crassisporium funariophilum]